MRAQLECDEGSAFLVWSPEGGELDASSVIGRKKCCWSRSAPILYSKLKFRCNNPLQLPEVFHGSQWGSLHHSLVEHIMRHPVSQAIVSGMENTLLPDEALLQTLAVNSPFRKTLIANHLRFIEWSAPAPTLRPPTHHHTPRPSHTPSMAAPCLTRRPLSMLISCSCHRPQLHGDANKYWASLGPQFHGGPMVLNVSLLRDKAFRTSAMFARKVDPSIYDDVLPLWDRWMALKLLTQGAALGQPAVAGNLLSADPKLSSNLPPPTSHETDSIWAEAGHPESSTAPASNGTRSDDSGRDEAAYDGEHEDTASPGAGFILAWAALLVLAGTCFACVVMMQEFVWCRHLCSLLRGMARKPGWLTRQHPE